MSYSLLFENRVAIVTGGGAGLGRAYAMELARRGVKVVVNDLGGSVDGAGASPSAAAATVDAIRASGGVALAHGANVTKPDEVADMVAAAIAAFGQVDVLINNAGILRDKSFSKMTIDDFRAVIDVHLMGSMICTKAVWDHMREQNFGRIAMTTSSSGLYGNFGQSNYGAAKMGLVGLMNVLAIEGAKNNVHVNAIAPAAATRMTEGLLAPEAAALLTVESVAAGMMALVCDAAPTRAVLAAGAGGYALVKTLETEGITLPVAEQTGEAVLAALAHMDTLDGAAEFRQGAEQTIRFITRAMALS